MTSPILTTDEAPLNAEMLMPGDVIVLNEPAHASSTIQHYGNTVPVPDLSHVRSFDELGIAFERNTWLHVGIVLSPDAIGCYLNRTQVTFERYASAAAPVRVMLNELRNTFILDELYIDTEVTEAFADFAANTDARIPWGALDKDGKYFILEVDNLLTNIYLIISAIRDCRRMGLPSAQRKFQARDYPRLSAAMIWRCRLTDSVPTS